jgi:hypothetical protein
MKLMQQSCWDNDVRSEEMIPFCEYTRAGLLLLPNLLGESLIGDAKELVVVVAVSSTR